MAKNSSQTVDRNYSCLKSFRLKSQLIGIVCILISFILAILVCTNYINNVIQIGCSNTQLTSSWMEINQFNLISSIHTQESNLQKTPWFLLCILTRLPLVSFLCIFRMSQLQDFHEIIWKEQITDIRTQIVLIFQIMRTLNVFIILIITNLCLCEKLVNHNIFVVIALSSSEFIANNIFLGFNKFQMDHNIFLQVNFYWELYIQLMSQITSFFFLSVAIVFVTNYPIELIIKMALSQITKNHRNSTTTIHLQFTLSFMNNDIKNLYESCTHFNSLLEGFSLKKSEQCKFLKISSFLPKERMPSFPILKQINYLMRMQIYILYSAFWDESILKIIKNGLLQLDSV